MVNTSMEGAAEPVRGLSFGTIADQYERYRPDYPGELADAVLHYAGRPVRTALDVGAGTGKATRLFAARGIQVTALEPDPAMAQVLERATRGMAVELVPTTFEQFDTARRFDLVYAGAAWHWTDPTTRWARAVELLAPAGVLALFGTPADVKDPDLSAALDRIKKQVLPDNPDTVHPWSMQEMADADGLTDQTRRDLPRSLMTTAADFSAWMGTVSAYLMLSPDVRAEALGRVRAVLPDRFEIDATVHLALARRR